MKHKQISYFVLLLETIIKKCDNGSVLCMSNFSTDHFSSSEYLYAKTSLDFSS